MAVAFQISLAILIAFSGIVLAISEGGPIPAATGPIALASLYFIDWRRIWKLSQTTLTALAIAAFIAAGLEYLFGGIDAPLVAAGHLLTYLTWILLANRKQDSVYWMLLALSILQIALAVFLSSRVWVGVGLVVYMLLAIWTLSVLLLYRSLFPSRDNASAARQSHSAEGTGIRTQNGIARQPHDIKLTGSFLRGDLALASFSVFMATSLFIFIPRFWLSAAVPGERDSGEPITGFTSAVRLGDLGEILESTAPVMAVKLFHASNGIPLTEEEYNSYLGIAPLFRGATQESYDAGFWQRWRRAEQVTYTANQPQRGDVRQEISLVPTGSDILFVTGDVVSLSVGPPRNASRMELSEEFIFRQFSSAEQSLVYQVVTTRQPRDTEFFRLRQDLTQRNESDMDSSLERRRVAARYSDRIREYLDTCLRVSGRLQRTHEMSRSLTASARNPTEAAKRILDHLQDGEQYAYSLKLGVVDPRADPVEDFLFNRKEGHCEYFAASMVLLLRCAGIPARLVTGFKGGLYSSDTQAFHIQQLHAHAWAEAYIDEHWVTFDPTPLARDVSVAEQQSSNAGVQQTSSWLWLWLVRYSRYEQARNVYQPIVDAARFTWELISELFAGKGEKIRQLWEFFITPRQWLSWGGALLLLALVCLAGGIVWLVRRLRRVKTMLQSLIRQLDLSGTARPIRVPFFERFTEIVNARGLARRPEQTAGEFAEDAWRLLNVHAPLAAQAISPGEFTAAFNAIRFGGQALPEIQLNRMDAWLQQLESMWPVKRNSGSIA